MSVSPRTGYIDLQNNGCYGVDFNRPGLTAEQLHMVCERWRDEGAAAVLPTVITAPLDDMCDRLQSLVTLRDADPLAKQLIPGFHIEGPFLSDEPGYRGAHPAEAMCDAHGEIMRRLLHAASGLTRLVTLAPERDPGGKVTRMLADQGITVSAGHTNASVDELRAGIDAGLSMFTHLGNGCPMHCHRHDNIVQRALSLREHLTYSFIPDGVHVPWPALGNYIALAGIDHCIAVTDAMPAAGLGPGRYTLGHWDVLVGEDMAAWAPDKSHLVGAAITMPQVEANLREHVGLSDDAIDKLTHANPNFVLSDG